MNFILATILLVLSSPAFAQNSDNDICRYLPEHVASDDVAYTPGVDVHGRSVVSADINAIPFNLPDVMQVPLTVDIVERARDAGADMKGVEGLSDLGMIEIYKNGRVSWNGQDWSSSFYALCGQTPPDAVISGANDIIATQKQNDMSVQSMDDERMISGSEYREYTEGK